MTTTVSPNEETATKVSVETIDTILEALDSAAGAIDGQHFSTGILGDFTTQRVPGNTTEISEIWLIGFYLSI